MERIDCAEAEGAGFLHCKFHQVHARSNADDICCEERLVELDFHGSILPSGLGENFETNVLARDIFSRRIGDKREG